MSVCAFTRQLYARSETGMTMLEEFNLSGKVQSVRYEKENETVVLCFDRTGKLVRQETACSDGTARLHTGYVYENGRLVSFSIYFVPRGQSAIFRGTADFDYNPEGLLVRSKYYGDEIRYEYDRQGNRVTVYGAYVKRGRKFDGQGRIAEEWSFDDKPSVVREFGVTDETGGSLPDREFEVPPYELPQDIYENNEHGDMFRITSGENSGMPAETITYVYDDRGNWTERTAGGNSCYRNFYTAELIYTSNFLYGQRRIARTITYYD